LNSVTPKLPKGVSVELAKDVTSVGWVYQYALVDTTGKYSIDQLRSYQDWYLRYALQTVPGVAEVAPIGGFVRQYQVNVDPNKLLAYKIPINVVSDAIQKSNNDVGGRLVEFTGREYMVRGRGYIRSLDDIGKTVIMYNAQTGTPVLVRDVATVTFGPDMRRGVGELDGKGEVVGGVVIMRYGENAQKVIEHTKEKLNDLKSTLPPGVKLVTTYDRSELIDRAVDNLRHTLIEELIIVSIVIMIFLWDLRSAIVPIITIPVTVILAFIPMQLMGMTAKHHVAGRPCSSHWRSRRRVRRYGRANSQEARTLGGGRPARPIPCCRNRGCEGSRRTELLCFAGHRRWISPGFHFGRPGGPSLQTARVHQELLHGNCGIAGDYIGSGSDALPILAHGRVPIPSQVACKCSQRDLRGEDPQRAQSPDQQAHDEGLSPGSRVCARSQVADDLRCFAGHGAERSCLFQARIGVHAAAR
jgi:hypothetical protein